MKHLWFTGLFSLVGCYYGPGFLLNKDSGGSGGASSAPQDTDVPHDSGELIDPEGSGELEETGQFTEDPPEDTYELWF